MKTPQIEVMPGLTPLGIGQTASAAAEVRAQVDVKQLSVTEKRYDVGAIAADIRIQLKRQFPGCAFAVTIKRYSGGQSMTVALMKAPFKPFASERDVNGNPMSSEYAQLNQYQLWDRNGQRETCNGYYLTPEAWETMKQASKIANRENWDNSDAQTDYFDTNYYLHIAIGKWDKPFVTIST